MTRKERLVTSLVFLILAIAAFSFAFHLYMKLSVVRRRSSIVEGTIVGKEPRSAPPRETAAYCAAKIEFRDDHGHAFTFTQKESSKCSSFWLGERRRVAYESEHPGNATTYAPESTWLEITFIAALGTLLLYHAVTAPFAKESAGD